MRSLFSNRYDNKRKEFYERYEAARALHPSLPLYERPKEPARQQSYDRSCKRRYKTYQELNSQSSEKYNSEEWLASDGLSIVVRHTIEKRNFEELMPKYDPTLATHEFSHIARLRQRGRRPTAIQMAKIVTEFAQQVGGVPTEENEDQDKENVDPGKVNKGQNSANSKGIFIEINRKEPVSEEVYPLEPNIVHNHLQVVDIQNLQMSQVKAKPKLKRDLAVKDTESMPSEKQCKITMPFRMFICPEASCRQQFEMRRCLTVHQRETGHHSWSHKCDRCGQIFRAEGFKRMHALGACERNLSKKNRNQATMTA
ncbi:uncharacterized protein [Drosophila kikkawai]|uniref:C2H2-type domain-containing protein n=1 Tax=Drosophila kikkawai TaxID=30033 RepID=A0ABM4GP77_DROKI